MDQDTELTDGDSQLTRVFNRTPSSWDPQDDVLLRHLKEQQKLGWKEIASYFNNRTPNACQFRWRRLRSGALKSHSPSSPVSPPAQLASTPVPKRPLSEVTNTEKPSSYVSKFQAVSQDASQQSQQQQQIQQQPKQETVSVPSYNQWTFHNQNPATMSDLKSSPASSANHSSSTPASSSNSEDPLAKQLSFLAQDALHQQQYASHNQIEALAPANHNIPWNEDEDELLSHRRERELSFAELSILLPTRSESDIWSRIDWLEKTKHEAKSQQISG